jgi:hypothetical protein
MPKITADDDDDTMMMMKTTPVRTAKVIMLVTVMSTEKMASPKTIVGSWWMMASRIETYDVAVCILVLS